MESSLEFGRDCKALRIHAKEKFPLGSRIQLKVYGELDSRDGKIGPPSYAGAMMRSFNPYISTNIGMGLHYDKLEKLTYRIRWKKDFPVTNDSNLSFNVKGFCKIDSGLVERKSKGKAEFVWSILDFQKDQDIRLKIGYEVTSQVPYLQIRENNWTVNADMDGKWNIRYNL